MDLLYPFEPSQWNTFAKFMVNALIWFIILVFLLAFIRYTQTAMRTKNNRTKNNKAREHTRAFVVGPDDDSDLDDHPLRAQVQEV